MSKKDEKKEMPATEEESPESRRNTDQFKMILELQRDMRAMGERMVRMEEAQGHMERSVPAVQHPLTKPDVLEAIANDGRQKFRVIEKYDGYGAKKAVGSILSAQHYPHLADNVAAGMRVVLHND